MSWKQHTTFAWNEEVVCLPRRTRFGVDLCLGAKLQTIHLGNTTVLDSEGCFQTHPHLLRAFFQSKKKLL